MDLCLSLTGLASTGVVIWYGVSRSEVVVFSLLAFTVPLVIFPWLERIMGVCCGVETVEMICGKNLCVVDVPPSRIVEGMHRRCDKHGLVFRVLPPSGVTVEEYLREVNKRSKRPTEWLSRLDVGVSTLSVLSAACASWGVVFTGVSWSQDTEVFQPVMWPVDAFHFVAVSFVTALVARRRPTAWFDLLSLFVGVITATVMLLAVKSFTSEWYVGVSYVDRVYGGVTHPFPNVTRISHAAADKRDMYYARFGCAILCAAFEFVATACRCLRFALTQCGERHGDKLKWSELVPSRWDEYTPIFVAFCVVAFTTLQLALVLVPYPRWVVYDSRHVVLLSSLVYFSVPQTPQTGMPKWQGLGAVGVLASGLVVSVMATWRTFDVVILTLANTHRLARLAGSDAPPHAPGVFSVQAYENEFQQGLSSFSYTYQYALYDRRFAPSWFAAGSVITHVVDLVMCGLGSAVLVVVTVKWVRKYYGDVLTTAAATAAAWRAPTPSKKR